MIYEKFSKPFRLSLFLATIICSSAALAQDPAYAPPPMFEDMTPPMVRPAAKDGNIVQPLSSPNTRPLDPATQTKPAAIPPRVSVDPNSTRAAAPAPNVAPAAPILPVAPKAVAVPPAPAQPKFMKPIIETPKTTQPSRPEVVQPAVVRPIAPPPPAPPPPMAVPSVPASPAPQANSAQRDPKESAIQGPKTMPALPAGEVSKDVMFDKAPAPSEPTIYERHQTEVQEKEATDTLTPVAPLPNTNIKPAAFEPAEQGILKKSIAFKPGQIGLVPADLDPISVGVAHELNADEKEDWRVQIRAYATPYGTGLSSDRRIALNRALSLRTALITRGVSASRIDVLAEGLQSDNSKPGDRIDIYLYGPSQE